MKLGRDEVLMARTFVKAFYQIRPGVDQRQEGVKESFKDKALLGMLPFWILQGVDPGHGKNR